jgi:L-asparaginase
VSGATAALGAPGRTVALLTTGGTIASHTGDTGVIATDGPAELRARLGPHDVTFVAREVLRLGSYRFAEGDLREVARAALAAAADPAIAGVVVTHGTDTMEETAFLTDAVHDGPAPIVFCGAQRDASQPDGDGPRNLVDALRLAADPAARGLGAMVCMAGRAWPARYAVKVDAARLDAFRAPEAGPLATLAGGAVRVHARPCRDGLLPPALLDASLPRVDVVTAYAGADGTLVRAALAAGARGLVVAGFGAGNVTPDMADALAHAITDGVPVLIASRCPDGATQPLYGGPGGGASLAAAGALFAGRLRPAHARLLLALALARDPARVAEAVAPYT